MPHLDQEGAEVYQRGFRNRRRGLQRMSGPTPEVDIRQSDLRRKTAASAPWPWRPPGFQEGDWSEESAASCLSFLDVTLYRSSLPLAYREGLQHRPRDKQV